MKFAAEDDVNSCVEYDLLQDDISAHKGVVGMANERHQQGNHDYLIELSSDKSEESDNDVQVIEHIEPDPKPISELWLNTDPDNSSTLHSENNPNDEEMSTDNDFIGIWTH